MTSSNWARTGSVVSQNSRITNLNLRRSVSGQAQTTTPQSSQIVLNTDSDMASEDVIELLCGDSVVDPKITLATLKQYYGAGGDMLLHYRLKQDVTIAQ